MIWLLAMVGHIGIWCAIFNRTHATAWPRRWRKLIEKLIVLVVLLPLVLSPIWLWRTETFDFFSAWSTLPVLFGYSAISVMAAGFFGVTWIWRIASYRMPYAVVPLEIERIDGEKTLGKRLTHGTFAKALSWFPGNQATDVALESFRIRLAQLPVGSEIKICQLSDFHFTGQIDISYFRMIIERVNAWQPDLVFITGDMVDEVPCLDWIGPVFEPLQARYGKYYLLGNHDRRMPSENDLRQRLEGVGLQRSGGKWLSVDVKGTPIKIAGNELPWFGGAERLEPIPDDQAALKILLTHSPDQIDWARRFQFHLIFAGHTHGGQIRLPIVGPIISPSKYGVKFAGGTFQIDQSIMHVSRGICGDEPIRINCLPEIGLFYLQGLQADR